MNHLLQHWNYQNLWLKQKGINNKRIIINNHKIFNLYFYFISSYPRAHEEFKLLSKAPLGQPKLEGKIAFMHTQVPLLQNAHSYNAEKKLNSKPVDEQKKIRNNAINQNLSGLPTT